MTSGMKIANAYLPLSMLLLMYFEVLLYFLSKYFKLLEVIFTMPEAIFMKVCILDYSVK